MTQDLQRRLETLWGLERRHLKLGLDGTRALLAGLGNPETRFAAVHVAGTNGKGSVCALVERVLRAAGRRTGLYTSPHLVDFRERIRVDGRWADEAELEAGLDRIIHRKQMRDEIGQLLRFFWHSTRGFAPAGGKSPHKYDPNAPRSA